MAIKIKVKNSGLIKISVRKDKRGNLFAAEALRQIPFLIRRVYFLTDFKNSNTARGQHAHKKLNQVIFCLRGSFYLSLDDGKQKQKIRLSNPSLGILLRPKLWHSMSRFSKDCVILVVASDYYKETDYIRDYSDFKKLK